MTETIILPVANVARFKVAQADHPALHENVAWFAAVDHRLLGVVVRDRYDDDFRWVTMRRDREMVTRIKLALPTAFPYQAEFADLAGRIAKLPP